MRTCRTTLQSNGLAAPARRSRRGAITFVGVALAMALGGCASVESVREQALDRVEEDSLDAAVQRWSRCVERRSSSTSIDPIATLRDVARVQHPTRQDCEGHRRDVAMRFPPHLESRVSTRLLRHEQLQMRTASASTDLAGATVGDWLRISPAD